MKTIFLSSTFRDLEDHRKAAIEAIESLDGYHCIRMENFGARDWESEEFCRAQVAVCDLFVGIVGHFHGSCPDGCESSYTECEYDEAVIGKRPRLMFLAPESFPVPADIIETDDKREKQQAFRERVNDERIRSEFSSPEDLARRIVQAIRNWEREQNGSQQSTSTQRSKVGTALPPQPYFAHAYPLQPNFTGRVEERKMLTKWLSQGKEPVFVLTAIGGMGKSALTWAWLLRDVLDLPLLGAAEENADIGDECRISEESCPEGVLWWSFYDREAGFSTFLDKALIYASAGYADPTDVPSSYDRAIRLAELLQQRRLLLVLDGLERVLRAYSSLDAAYRGDQYDEDERGDFRSCPEPYAAEFLKRIASLPLQSRVLITSRLLPRELDDLAGRRHEHLDSMAPEDAVAFFGAQGVDGTRAEIEDVCSPYGYHPLAIRLLAGVIVKDHEKPGDIQVAHRHRVLPELRGKEQHHILDVAYNTLGKQQRTLLSRISAFRSPAPYDALVTLSIWGTVEKFDAALNELMERDLLFFDHQQRRYDLHPIVRQYAYERLANRKDVHIILREHFASLPIPSGHRIQSLQDLASIIELYHHSVRASKYDEALVLFSKLIHEPLYFRFGAYRTSAELVRALFPSGEDQLPQISKETGQAWAMNMLANSYALSGQPRRALPLFQTMNTLQEKTSSVKNLAIGLGNLACMAQIHLGEIRAAESNLHRSIELSRTLSDTFLEATERQKLVSVLAYRGEYEQACTEFGAALATFQDLERYQSESLLWTEHAFSNMLDGRAAGAASAGRQARDLADRAAGTGQGVERDFVRSEWMLGWSLTASTLEDGAHQPENLAQAAIHLTEALTRCRRINLVENEPDILLAWARWHRAKDNPEQARKDALEALSIADRCEYRLCQADIHNFLARLDIEAGDRDSAVKHAQTGYERAWCDGPPYCYKPALDEAERLLEELGAPRPKMPDA